MIQGYYISIGTQLIADAIILYLLYIFIIELPLSTVPQLSSESQMGEQNGKSNLPMPMVIAAANKARCLQKVPTISFPDSDSDAVISSETKTNGQAANEGTNKNGGGVKCSLLQLAVAVASPRKSSPKTRANEGITQKF